MLNLTWVASPEEISELVNQLDLSQSNSIAQRDAIRGLTRLIDSKKNSYAETHVKMIFEKFGLSAIINTLLNTAHKKFAAQLFHHLSIDRRSMRQKVGLTNDLLTTILNMITSKGLDSRGYGLQLLSTLHLSSCPSRPLNELIDKHDILESIFSSLSEPSHRISVVNVLSELSFLHGDNALRFYFRITCSRYVGLMQHIDELSKESIELFRALCFLKELISYNADDFIEATKHYDFLNGLVRLCVNVSGNLADILPDIVTDIIYILTSKYTDMVKSFATEPWINALKNITIYKVSKNFSENNSMIVLEKIVASCDQSKQLAINLNVHQLFLSLLQDNPAKCSLNNRKIMIGVIHSLLPLLADNDQSILFCRSYIKLIKQAAGYDLDSDDCLALEAIINKFSRCSADILSTFKFNKLCQHALTDPHPLTRERKMHVPLMKTLINIAKNHSEPLELDLKSTDRILDTIEYNPDRVEAVSLVLGLFYYIPTIYLNAKNVAYILSFSKLNQTQITDMSLFIVHRFWNANRAQHKQVVLDTDILSRFSIYISNYHMSSTTNRLIIAPQAVVSSAFTYYIDILDELCADSDVRLFLSQPKVINRIVELVETETCDDLIKKTLVLLSKSLPNEPTSISAGSAAMFAKSQNKIKSNVLFVGSLYIITSLVSDSELGGLAAKLLLKLTENENNFKKIILCSEQLPTNEMLSNYQNTDAQENVSALLNSCQLAADELRNKLADTATSKTRKLGTYVIV